MGAPLRARVLHCRWAALLTTRRPARPRPLRPRSERHGAVWPTHSCVSNMLGARAGCVYPCPRSRTAAWTAHITHTCGAGGAGPRVLAPPPPRLLRGGTGGARTPATRLPFPPGPPARRTSFRPAVRARRKASGGVRGSMGKVRGLRARVHQAAVRPAGQAPSDPAPPAREAAPAQAAAGGVGAKVSGGAVGVPGRGGRPREWGPRGVREAGSGAASGREARSMCARVRPSVPPPPGAALRLLLSGSVGVRPGPRDRGFAPFLPVRAAGEPGAGERTAPRGSGGRGHEPCARGRRV